MSWHKGMLCAFDLESTGVHVDTARIVTGCVSLINGTTGEAQTKTLLANPGIDIPEQATAIHGITTEHAREHGDDPAVVTGLLADTLMQRVYDGVPIVGCNVVYDFTLLDRETRRHGLEPFGDRLAAAQPVAIDVYVLDKAIDRYRKGSRKLTDLCSHYGVRIDGAHDASHDAIAAARVAYRIAQRNPRIAGMPLHDLHALQVKAKAEQARSFRDYLAQQGKPHGDVREEWPLIPFTTTPQGVEA
ncbi:3'-5' exonuclease [Nonomuraea rhodomycinica]|uniref:3'-5' exonuclease n=1 Tax=Nonomuraea rhodomycinica TaxID=1712872 RepID=A0A7Y6IWY3_9ACTN|nr:3'-5' exonuclease [Nonomuraea rhodomycinica]NUW45591.1 3'-5' exonuclease [Nonomuraea rhodomycinica]